MTRTKNLFVLGTTSIVFTLAAIHAAQRQSTPSLPYTAVHDPQFLPASSAAFLHDPDRIIGLWQAQSPKPTPGG